ncbi:MAG: adenylate kinase [Clostridia bacterium]|nr:adenylate kinase [Clostridia bacterium]
MIILISGATHTGKTLLSQKLMEQCKIPYLSIDHLKMGLIRSGQTSISVSDDKRLTPYLWSIVKEIIKTTIENTQNLIIEGCYIPFDWQKNFTDKYLSEIKYYCLIMSEEYIENNFSDIVKYENLIENRLQNAAIDKQNLIKENINNLQLCKKYNLDYILINNDYDIRDVMNICKQQI